MSQVFDDDGSSWWAPPCWSATRALLRDTATVSASENGVLVYKGATEASQLTWFDRQSGESGVRASPDCTVGWPSRPWHPSHRRPDDSAGDVELGVVAVRRRQPLDYPLTVPQPGSTAIWSADGSRIPSRHFASDSKRC